MRRHFKSIRNKTFRNSVDSSSMGVRIMGDVDHTVYANQALLHMFGYKNIDELNTSRRRNITHPNPVPVFSCVKSNLYAAKHFQTIWNSISSAKTALFGILQLSSKNVFWDASSSSRCSITILQNVRCQKVRLKNYWRESHEAQENGRKHLTLFRTLSPLYPPFMNF